MPAGTFTALWADIESRYRAVAPDIAFGRTSSNPLDRRLDFCAWFLATIQALEQRGDTFDGIRTICLQVTHACVEPRHAWQRWLKRLPVLLIRTPLLHLVTRVMAARTGQKGHPDGFLVRIVTGRADTYGLGYGFDILECGICTLFAKHGAAKYVPILCEVDRLTSSLAGLELIRQGTIANGAATCDFRFRLKPSR